MAAKAERKPMTFDLPKSAAAPAPVTVPKADAAARQQVGARVTKATYRQLKARAALSGSTVQALVEQAIDEFLARQTT